MSGGPSSRRCGACARRLYRNGGGVMTAVKRGTGAEVATAEGGGPYFDERLFVFLRDLAANNDRGWFEQNRERYDVLVRDAAFRFIAAFSHPLHRISSHFEAVPKAVGGSLFRIHRDVRFSHDKSPYKTHVGIHFRHRAARDAHAPGFYLHLEPRNCFAGVGIWRPDSETTRRIRQAIAAPRSGWGRAVGAGFAEHLELAGEQLQRMPRGFEADHPKGEDLRRKSFIGVAELSDAEVLAPDFLERYDETCRAGAGLNRFICRALDLPF
ncbi:MAG: TIGR02453 family protein [Acidobacteria bacterium]|nr:MAG: TIGR02453 family protein [Acidobacteriota bacterium]